MKLSSKTIRNIKAPPQGKVVRISESGLCFVARSDSRFFVARFNRKGKIKDFYLGTYPALGIREARRKRDFLEAIVLLTEACDRAG